MFRTLFHAAMYWSPMLLVCILIAARATAPFPYTGPNYTQPLTASLNAIAQQMAYRNELYVKIDGSDPSPEILADLNGRQLPATFTAWSARSAAQDHCQPSTFNEKVVGACMRDNFLSADFLSMPLWHVALVRVQTAACSAELTLVRGSALWHVMSQKVLCI